MEQVNAKLTADQLNAGMYVVLSKVDSVSRVGYMCTVMQQIGYCLDAPSYAKQYNLVSVADGFTFTNLGQYFTKEELAEYLNSKDYRLATKEEVFKVMEHLKKNYIL